jgi:hypothetical protein
MQLVAVDSMCGEMERIRKDERTDGETDNVSLREDYLASCGGSVQTGRNMTAHSYEAGNYCGGNYVTPCSPVDRNRCSGKLAVSIFRTDDDVLLSPKGGATNSIGM